MSASDHRQRHHRFRTAVGAIGQRGLAAEALVARFGPVTDFFGIGEEIWAATDAAQNLKRLVSCLG